MGPLTLGWHKDWEEVSTTEAQDTHESKSPVNPTDIKVVANTVVTYPAPEEFERAKPLKMTDAVLFNPSREDLIETAANMDNDYKKSKSRSLEDMPMEDPSDHYVDNSKDEDYVDNAKEKECVEYDATDPEDYCTKPLSFKGKIYELATGKSWKNHKLEKQKAKFWEYVKKAKKEASKKNEALDYDELASKSPDDEKYVPNDLKTGVVVDKYNNGEKLNGLEKQVFSKYISNLSPSEMSEAQKNEIIYRLAKS